jgi:hypothetical protein
MNNKDFNKILNFLGKAKVLSLMRSKEAKQYYFDLDKTEEGKLFYSLPFNVASTISLYVDCPNEVGTFFYKGNQYKISNESDLKKFIDSLVDIGSTDIYYTDFYKDYGEFDLNLKHLIEKKNKIQTSSLKDIQNIFLSNGVLDPTKEELEDYRLREFKLVCKDIKNYQAYLKQRKVKRDLILSQNKVEKFFDVEAVLNNVSVLSVLDYYNIKYKDRGGAEIICSSPFREDRNPSFSINKENKLWIDFSTGESGNIVGLVSKMEGFDKKQNFKDIINILKNLNY